MTEFERRLAAALHSAADGAEPARGLVEKIIRRRRRHRARLGVTAVTATAAAAIAVPLAVPAIRDAAGGQSRQTVRPTAGAQPGTVLQGCADQIEGQYSANWRRQSIHAGPLWLVYARGASATRDGSSPLPFGNLAANIADGSYAWIKVVGPSRSYFRFLFGAFNGSGSYTLRSGETGVTFAACSGGRSLSTYYPGYTQFWGGFVIAKFPACVSLDVWTRASSRPIRVTMQVGAAHCG